MPDDKKYKIIPSKEFYRELKSLSSIDKERVAGKLLIFEENPFHPSFRTKKMKGGFDCYESSINMDIRIFWYFQDDKIIVLTKIGHHDVIRKYKGKK